MKNSIVKVVMLFVVAFMTVSCSDDETPVPALDVNPINLHGIWELQELNGAPLSDGLFVYIDLNRKGSYKLYQNNDSMEPRCITGTFSVRKDPRIGSIVSGVYDFGNGPWNNEYIVTDLLESGSMIWTVKNGSEVSKYVRVNEIPSEILESVK